MTRRWTPRQFIVHRRVRVAFCALLATIVFLSAFFITARKSVALTVNGQTRTITTYAYSVDALLRQAGVKVKTHDQVESTAGGQLHNHDVVTVRSAYQTTINIEGQQVPFWTNATSADQLLDFFEMNRRNALKVTIDVKNIYNQLTGGLVINQSGPVTVIADGKSSVAPNGKLPAASILDSKGLVLGREDRVSVEKDQGTTILRVRRVTHGQTTRNIPIPFATRTVIDTNLAPGQAEIRQAGVNGQKVETVQVTYVDGQAESENIVKEETALMPVDQVVAVGPDQSAPQSSQKGEQSKSDQPRQDNSKKDENTNSPTTPPTQPDTSGGSSPGSEGSGTSGNSGSSGGTGNPVQPSPPSPGGLWHASAGQAMTYAAGAAAQRGWTGSQFDDLVKLWNRESGWRWNAENPGSHAYGIPQSLPADKMARFGANWRDDAAIQIDWGLWYIAQSYGSPSKAWEHSEQHGWY